MLIKYAGKDNDGKTNPVRGADLKNGDWQTDAHYSDREEALDEARNLYGQGHLDGVKVIGEVYDDQTGTSKEQTIFDTTKKVTVKSKNDDSAGAVPPREGRVKLKPPTTQKEQRFHGCNQSRFRSAANTSRRAGLSLRI